MKETWVTLKAKGSSIDLFGFQDVKEALQFAETALTHTEELKVEIECFQREEDFLDDPV